MINWIKNENSFCKTATVLLCLILLCGTNLFAQLSLRNTNWSGTFETALDERISLQFGDGNLSIMSLAKNEESVFSFRQQDYNLVVFDASDKGKCQKKTGVYRLEYKNSGQQLSFKLIQDDCGSRINLFTDPASFELIPNQTGAARNWFQLDPTDASIAGISLKKAYELLRERKSKTIIVAVIDNGVDVTHEDLKDVIWTNPREIPNNGVDDDHNGYVDDIHGWNFRGAKDGTTVENEQSEATRIYSTWKNKYETINVNRLSQSEKKEYDIYTKAKDYYLKKLKDITDATDLKFAYNLNYNSSELIGDNPANLSERSYGSPFMRLTPNLSHGTHVAGIIAAQRNNQKGVDGIADNILIMPILATTATGDERDKDVANAIRYAVDNGAHVINMSFSKRFSPYKKIVDEAIRYAEKRNVLIVHAAGNDGEDIDVADNYHYPIAIYDDGKKATNFITVGWSRSKFDYRLAHPYSDYGVKNVDVFAPGSDIFSTVPGNAYDFKSGSSMATPLVSGVAALLLSNFPTLSAAQVKDILLKSSFKPETTVNKPGTKTEVPFRDLSASGGIVNAYNAIELAIATEKNKTRKIK